MARIALLPERGVVRVAGEDAEKLLQGLITNDLDRLKSSPAIHAGLLSPQGKILFEFFVVKRGLEYLLDVRRDKADDLIKRLTLYKLRAKVSFDNLSQETSVAAVWGDGSEGNLEASPLSPLRYPDPRQPGLGKRWLIEASAWNDLLAKLPELSLASEAEYHAHRIALGVPEADMDYVLGDTFPHEACFDLLGGVAFDKGCFVGQEVVSRMQHRGLARKRFVIVRGVSDLPPARAEISFASPSGRAVIGALGSPVGSAGLALVRIDRASEAIGAGLALEADGVKVSLEAPAWANYTLPPAK
ncbi:MAG: YgfZ/GcvT domain-containing protein [Bacteroidota bacterium]